MQTSDALETGDGEAEPAPRGARVLYLSYDGMCDPLGGSQVLPYLFGLARRGHDIDLISFEKPERSEQERSAVAQACAAGGIRWHPLAYHKWPPVLSSIYDVIRMGRLAVRLQREHGFDLVHCRSYLAALVGLRLKRRYGLPFIFDMRGFWADERVDGGQWNLSNPVFRAVHAYFKKREGDFLAEAAQVVSLTQAAKRIMLGWEGGRRARAPITVIPCCVDFDAFPPVTPRARASARRRLGIGPKTKVAGYLGSFGSWYMVAEMMDFFRVQLERDSTAVFLIVSREPAEEVMAVARARRVPADRLVVRAASRSEVPELMAAADYGLFFIKPVFSKTSSSPTKMGELLALELPMVTNGGVGDVEQILAETGAGIIVDRFEEEAYRSALDAIGTLKPDMARWRAAARRWLDLEFAVGQYDAIYGATARSASSR
jgi:glycosyltransferase involved in cell wall biosynthesis